jgi:hypothetical protein
VDSIRSSLGRGASSGGSRSGRAGASPGGASRAGAGASAAGSRGRSAGAGAAARGRARATSRLWGAAGREVVVADASADAVRVVQVVRRRAIALGAVCHALVGGVDLAGVGVGHLVSEVWVSQCTPCIQRVGDGWDGSGFRILSLTAMHLEVQDTSPGVQASMQETMED